MSPRPPTVGAIRTFIDLPVVLEIWPNFQTNDSSSSRRSQLDQWTKRARIEAYAEPFEGDDPILSPEEVQLLDALDSELERQGDDGV